MVGVREGHPFATESITLQQFADADHLTYSRRGLSPGPIDHHLADDGLRRRVLACTSTPVEALFLLGHSDLIGVLPHRLSHDARELLHLSTVRVPFELSMAWHPRTDTDGAHRWLRQSIRDAVYGSAAA